VGRVGISREHGSGTMRKIDAFTSQCHIRRVKTKKPATSPAGDKSSGVRVVEKYRPRMSRLSDAERQKLMARGLQIIYGRTPVAKSTHRG
jgi:hypothetical protein